MDNNNLIAAIALSILILMGFQYFYVKPQQEQAQQEVLAEKLMQQVKPVVTAEPTSVLRDHNVVLKESPRLPIITPQLSGSVDLKGARLDDLSLTNFRETVDPGAPAVTLLSPAGSDIPNLAYYADVSWLADNDKTAVPTAQTEWKADGKELTPDHPLKLTWDNGQGLKFERIITVDDEFMFTLTDHVQNTNAAPVTLYPFGLIARQGNPATRSSYILHEGALGVVNGTLEEHKYKTMMSDGKKAEESQGGWLGITDKYWLVAMVPPADEKLTVGFTYNLEGQTNPDLGYFQTDFRGTPVTLAAGASADHKVMFFAGAKRQKLLERYKDQYNIPLFDRAIDYGWFWFLTIPFLHLLNFLSSALGSYGLALLLFTVLLKVVTLPLSLKSNHSMSRMKDLQPEMKRLQERYKDDKVKQSAEMMELYKREGVNPLSGCMPTLIQIPIFFALYKVIYVGIEMRQAPFYGWIKDLSVPDPTSVLTLFGAIDWTPPTALQIGVWPLLMGCSMFLQQRLSPQPPDKSQARMFMFMPIFFTYLLARMPAGLVIYWTWSNLLSSLQQWFIMRRDAKRKANKA
ncbi:MAG: membrane protein insertase YidC [Pseudomonadota bacterium]|nr:membrane protein insertase YidC [Pseudomonadota bacterium]